MELLAVFISVSGLIIYAALLLKPLPNLEPQDPKEQPFVSILISVRNESPNIQNLLLSIKGLNYPKEKFEVLIGDDNSDDDTLDQCSGFKNENIHCYAYKDTDDRLTGKQYVLSKLISRAKGDYMFFTDGDMVLSPNWIQSMLLNDSIGMRLMVGLTEVRGELWFAKLQNIDWLLNQFFIMWLSQRGETLTVWGNNLATNKATLVKVKWPTTETPCIVEDVELMHQVLEEGGSVEYVYNQKNTTKHEKLFDLLNQRKRWMHGMGKVPLKFKILAFIRLLFLPAALYLVSIHVTFGIFIIIKCIFLGEIFRRLSKISNIRFWWLGILVFDLYEVLLYLITFIYFLMPFKNKWKGRTY